MSFAPPNVSTAFLPTSQVFPEDISQLLIVLTQNFISNSYATNVRQLGFYKQVENLTGQYFFSSDALASRLSFRKVFEVGAIAAGVTATIAHGITGVTLFSHIYGTVITAVPDYRPLPRVDAATVTNGISLDVNATNIVIVNGATAPNIVSGIVVLEYLKN